MKWYFCIDEIGANEEIGSWSIVAIQSAIKRGDLTPICLYDGEENNDYLRVIGNLGARIIRTRSSIASHIERAHALKNFPLHAKGAFLRAEICEIEKDDQFVLYTDCDVFYRNHDILWDSIRPRIFAAAARQNLYDVNQFNSGVMMINVEEFRRVRNDFLNFAADNLGPYLPGIDEPLFNAFFRDSFESLPIGLNWRPFFGHNESAAIIHFHGPKMRHLDEFVHKGASVNWGRYASDLSNLISSSLHSYNLFVTEVLANTEPPGKLYESMTNFLKGYRDLSTTVFKRYGNATLVNSELKQYIDLRSRKIETQVSHLVNNISRDKFVFSKYVIDRDVSKYPHLLLSIFETNGFGCIKSLVFRFSNGSAYTVPFEELKFRSGRPIDGAADRSELDGLVSNGGYPVELVIGESKERNRATIKSIELVTLSLRAEPLNITFSDVEDAFFPCNRITLPPQMLGSSSHSRMNTVELRTFLPTAIGGEEDC